MQELEREVRDRDGWRRKLQELDTGDTGCRPQKKERNAKLPNTLFYATLNTDSHILKKVQKSEVDSQEATELSICDFIQMTFVFTISI